MKTLFRSAEPAPCPVGHAPSPILAALHRHNEQLEQLAAVLHELELRLTPILLEECPKPIPMPEKEETVSPMEGIIHESYDRTAHCIRRAGTLLESLRI